jgi:L-iditol 2-dehydrogenase
VSGEILGIGSLTMKGLAKVATGPGGIELVERRQPTPSRGQVIIDVEAAGVCGTDLHIERGELDVPRGIILGHEVAGVVAAVGAGVSADWLGTRVVSETYYSTCGRCDRCLEGRPNLCASRRSIGIHVDGAFAGQLAVPAGNLHRIADSISMSEAALIEPLACVCRCLLQPQAVAPGTRVLVVGPGPIGLLAAQVARLTAAEVIVAGLPADVGRLALAGELGLTTTVDDPGQAAFDVSIECSGAGPGATTALRAVRKGGTYVQMGLFGREVTIPLDELVTKELDVRTGYATIPSSWKLALGLAERGDVRLGALISEVASLAEYERVFGDLRAGRAAKVVFDPRQ